MVVKVLVTAGATVQAQAVMYKTVVQIMLLYGSESWVVTGVVLIFLEGFHHRFARWISGMTAQ